MGERSPRSQRCVNTEPDTCLAPLLIRLNIQREADGSVHTEEREEAVGSGAALDSNNTLLSFLSSPPSSFWAPSLANFCLVLNDKAAAADFRTMGLVDLALVDVRGVKLEGAF